jgi:Cu(I)/Ag(I) efflux system membrane fusion protein
VSKRKRSLFPLFLAAIVGAALGGFAANYTHVSSTNTKTSERKILFYQSPMHPWITSDKPGKCTICGMALAPVFEGDEPIPQGGNFLKLSDKTAAVINVQTTAARLAPLHRTLRVAGMITDDETRHRILSARVPGRIEKLYVNQVGIEVTRQQPLADVFSPDVLTSQRLYLENMRAGASGAVSPSEIATSREQLLAVGLVEEDIQRLEQTQKPEKIFALRTPFDGTVVSRKVYEGQYVKVDDELFEIGDFSSLWFIFDAYEQDLPLLKINQSVDVTIPSFEGETVSAPITFIDPNLNENTRTARVRVVLPNPQRRILNRQTANGLIHLETEPAVLIPRSALLYTHQFPAAYVDLGNGAYQFRQLRLGKVGDADVEILDGIQEGEHVVTHAALLIDSQSQLAHIAEGQKAENVSETAQAETEAPV